MSEPTTSPRAISLLKAVCGIQTPHDRRNQITLLRWILGFGITFLAAVWLSETGRVGDGGPGIGLALVPSAFAAGAIWSYMRYVREADELARTIQLQAIATGFGVTIGFLVLYPLFEQAGAPAAGLYEAAVIGMCAFAGGELIATARYR